MLLYDIWTITCFVKIRTWEHIVPLDSAHSSMSMQLEELSGSSFIPFWHVQFGSMPVNFHVETNTFKGMWCIVFTFIRPGISMANERMWTSNVLATLLTMLCFIHSARAIWYSIADFAHWNACLTKRHWSSGRFIVLFFLYCCFVWPYQLCVLSLWLLDRTLLTLHRQTFQVRIWSCCSLFVARQIHRHSLLHHRRPICLECSFHRRK